MQKAFFFDFIGIYGWSCLHGHQVVLPERCDVRVRLQVSFAEVGDRLSSGCCVWKDGFEIWDCGREGNSELRPRVCTGLKKYKMCVSLCLRPDVSHSEPSLLSSPFSLLLFSTLINHPVLSPSFTLIQLP
jgi:hypothetical protein